MNTKSLSAVVVLVMLVYAHTLYAQVPVADSGLNHMNVVYFHPISFVLFTALKVGVPVYVTYERATGEGRSSLVIPVMVSYLNFPILDGYDYEIGSTKGVDVGAGAHMRKYMSHVQRGFFLEGGVNAEFFSLSNDYTSMGYEDRDYTEFDLSVLGYVGYRGTWPGFSLFINAGVGYMYGSGSTSTGLTGSGTGPAWDINIGFGFPF